MLTEKNKSAIELKKERMKDALEMLKAVKEIEYTKAIALFCFNLGLSERKAGEYIRTLRVLRKISINDGRIKVRK